MRYQTPQNARLSDVSLEAVRAFCFANHGTQPIDPQRPTQRAYRGDLKHAAVTPTRIRGSARVGLLRGHQRVIRAAQVIEQSHFGGDYRARPFWLWCAMEHQRFGYAGLSSDAILAMERGHFGFYRARPFWWGDMRAIVRAHRGRPTGKVNDRLTKLLKNINPLLTLTSC